MSKETKIPEVTVESLTKIIEEVQVEKAELQKEINFLSEMVEGLEVKAHSFIAPLEAKGRLGIQEMKDLVKHLLG